MHLKELNERHRTFMGLRQTKIMNSDNESYFIWVKWFNPQSRRVYILACAVAKEAEISIGVNFRDKPQAQAKVFRIFSCGEKGDFNLWKQEPHILTPSHSTGDSDNGKENDSEHDSDVSDWDVDISDV